MLSELATASAGSERVAQALVDNFIATFSSRPHSPRARKGLEGSFFGYALSVDTRTSTLTLIYLSSDK